MCAVRVQGDGVAPNLVSYDSSSNGHSFFDYNSAVMAPSTGEKRRDGAGEEEFYDDEVAAAKEVG